MQRILVKRLIQRLLKRAFNIAYMQPLKDGQLAISLKIFYFVLSQIIYFYIFNLVLNFGTFVVHKNNLNFYYTKTTRKSTIFKVKICLNFEICMKHEKYLSPYFQKI